MAWYKSFFEKYYLDLYIPRGEKFKLSYVRKEIAFIKRVLDLPKGARILDLCCGHGRHLLPLAKMGYQMTGLDLSEKALAILAESAKNKKIKIRIIRSDMRKIPFESEFDAVINMFSAFGYLETDYEDFKVLKAVAKALKPGGKFLIDIMNRDWMLANFQPKSWEKIGKLLVLEERIYDAKTHRLTVKIQILDEKGRWHKTAHTHRVYSLGEIRKNLSKAGLKIIQAYGDTIGNKEFTRDSRRLVILATKARSSV
jgi:SAM-dependent methyltransferase